MKRLFLILVAAIVAGVIPTSAQNRNSSGAALVTLNAIAVSEAGFQASSQTYMRDKLMQIIMQNGLGSADYNSRFVLTAGVVPVTKDFVAGPPRQVSQTLDYTFYIVDNYDQKVFATSIITVKVVEASEEKAFLRSIRSINAKDARLVSFVKEGREKIVAYYNAQIDRIISKARLCAKTKDFEQAFFELAAVPEACGEAFDKAVAAAGEIFSEYVNFAGERLLAKAKAAWAAQQNADGAALAGQYLSEIYPEAACYPQAETLYKEIKAKVLADWKFEMKIYQDGVDLEKQRIDAWRQVGIAYGEHQQPTSNNIAWLFK